MSNSNYNKIISTINSVSQDYTYSPDPNNLICIDTSNNRIGINTIDPSCALHISGGDIQVNRIFANSVFASHYGATDSPNASSINATTISASTISATTISASTIRATTNIDVSKISVSSILDISKGLILANTISGSAITINANANVSSDIITIDIGTSTGVNINTPIDSTRNAITINGARVATTQHITNAIPYGVIVAYYSSTNIPNGWALCDGNNSTPDLRGRFILGSNPLSSGTSNGLDYNIVNVSGGEENVSSFTTITGASSTTLATISSTNIISFNNMPPYYVLVYIMKIETDFCYNTVITYPSAPIFSMSQINDTSVRLTWTQPSNIGNSPITQYKIYKNDVFLYSVSGNIRTYDINNLDIGNTYRFSLTASNSILESNRAPIQSIQIMGVPIPPGIPRNLTNLTQGSNTITISWLVPIIIGNPALIGYIVNVDGIDKPQTSDLTYTESNVIPNRTYTFKVKSTSGSLTSDYTPIVYVTTIVDT